MHEDTTSFINVKGHVKIEDDLGTVYVDKDNAVHPQNMARIIARGFANESNFQIWRIALGNGGTEIDAVGQITYKTPNDGLPPDTATWDSRLYNETYSEIIDEGNPTLNPELGTDPGSSGPEGQRPGGGAVPADDPPTVPHVSGPGVRSTDNGLTSDVVITSVLNPAEPLGQSTGDQLPPTEDPETAFFFDEMGLYCPGAPASDSSGYQQVDLNGTARNSEDDTGLLTSTVYDFSIAVDDPAFPSSTTFVNISFTTPAGGGTGTGNEILYGDLCQAMNTNDAAWGFSAPLPSLSAISITDSTTFFSTITGDQTYGFLQFISGTADTGSNITLQNGVTNDLFAALEGGLGSSFEPPVAGQDAGAQNNPTLPDTERERLMSHLIFSPVLKSANRTLTITYTLTISIARTT